MIEEQGEWLAYYQYSHPNDEEEHINHGSHAGVYPEPHQRLAEIMDFTTETDYKLRYFETVWVDDWI